MTQQLLLVRKIDLHAYPELKKQMELIGFTAVRYGGCKIVSTIIKEGIDEIISVFYEKILEIPSLLLIIYKKDVKKCF